MFFLIAIGTGAHWGTGHQISLGHSARVARSIPMVLRRRVFSSKTLSVGELLS